MSLAHLAAGVMHPYVSMKWGQWKWGYTHHQFFCFLVEWISKEDNVQWTAEANPLDHQSNQWQHHKGVQRGGASPPNYKIKGFNVADILSKDISFWLLFYYDRDKGLFFHEFLSCFLCLLQFYVFLNSTCFLKYPKRLPFMGQHIMKHWNISHCSS